MLRGSLPWFREARRDQEYGSLITAVPRFSFILMNSFSVADSLTMNGMTSLPASDILQWIDADSAHWLDYFQQHPDALLLPCDIRGSSTVADLVQHIVAVELRYAQRLSNQPVTDYASIPKSPIADLFAVHTQATQMFQTLLADPSIPWHEEIQLQTRSEGALIATRRTVLFHALLHSMRHYAQLATLLRQNGIPTHWPMDFLMFSGRRA
jgi:uncharacterized damage-inducible protein DinB